MLDCGTITAAAVHVTRELHLIACVWHGPYEAHAWLSTDEDAVEADVVAHVRIAHDSAPGACFEAAELTDVDGDGDGVAEWLYDSEHELLGHWGRPS